MLSQSVCYVNRLGARLLAHLSDPPIVGRGKGKGTCHPSTGHKGPEGEKTYSSTPSLTSALDGGSTPRPSCFTFAKDMVPIVE